MEAESAYALSSTSPLPAKMAPPLWAVYERGKLHYSALGIHEFADFKTPVMLEDPRHATFSINNVFSALRLRLYAALLPALSSSSAARKPKGNNNKASTTGDARTVVEYIQCEKRYKTRKVDVPAPAFLAVDLLVPKTTLDARLKALLALFDSDCVAIRSLPPAILSVGCLARYLLQHTTHPQLVLSRSEYHNIIVTLLVPRLGLPFPLLDKEPPLARRSIHTCNLAQLCSWYFTIANDVCGQPVSVLPAHAAFNGNLWQYVWQRSSAPLAELCLGNADLLAAFNAITTAAAVELPPYVWRGEKSHEENEERSSKKPPPAAAAAAAPNEK